MRSKTISTSIVVAFVFACVFAPIAPLRAADLEVAGWIPYWAGTKGTKDAERHLDELDTIHPFVFTIKQDGTLSDLGHMSKSHWKKLFREARKDDVEVIPTIMTSDGAHVHRLLSNPESRKAHIKAIVEMVEDGDFDGVDIDYEGKMAETKDFFSIFLRELKDELDGKLLTCAIEARTPPDSLYRTIPATIQYANDYNAIGTYCDRIEIMAYDQRRADIKLNDAKAGEPYIPVADADWVKKVIEFTALTIPKDKIMLGIPTYGQEYMITTLPNWYREYARVSAVNPPDAKATAKKYKVTPSRNKAGELSFSYQEKGSAIKLSSSIDIPRGTSSGNTIAARALAYANKNNALVVFNYVTWSDAEAIAQKVELAEELGIRGVALFKIDGEEDRNLWKLFD